MFKRLQNIFTNKNKPKSHFTKEQYNLDYEQKKQGLERMLGEMYHLVGHAIIPFQVGGTVDMYYFPNALDGTGFATMELIEPDGSGPKPSNIGTYELVAFTKLKVGDKNDKESYSQIERRICSIFTVCARYSTQAVLNPKETVEVPIQEGEANRCLILDEYTKPGTDFYIGSRRHGLLLVIEVFRSEMEYAMKHGSSTVLGKLKEKGFYPYSDLDRDPIV